ncbi:hypothetical protein D3C71_1730210 [compost metagenome]
MVRSGARSAVLRKALLMATTWLCTRRWMWVRPIPMPRVCTIRPSALRSALALDRLSGAIEAMDKDRSLGSAEVVAYQSLRSCAPCSAAVIGSCSHSRAALVMNSCALGVPAYCSRTSWPRRAWYFCR